MEGKKIKIAYIVNDLSIGGAQRIIFDICSLIDRNRFEVVIIYFTDHQFLGKSNFVNEFEEKGIRLVCLNRHTNKKNRLVTFSKLFRQLKSERPDVVHIFLPDAVVFGTFASRLSGIDKIIVHEMNSHAFFSKKLHYAFETARFFSKLSICYSENLEKELFGKSNFLNKPVDQVDFRSCTILDGINTKDIRESLLKVDRNEARRSLGMKEEEIMLLSVARLIDWKGHMTLLGAFFSVAEALPNLKLYIAGDGPMKQELESEISKQENLQIKNRAKLLGSRNDAYALMMACDIFSLAIEYPKGFESISLGMSSMEALAIGAPSIASKYKDLYPGIEHKKNIMLVDPGSTQDLASKISDLACNADLRAKLSANSKEYVEQNFSADEITKIYESLYERL